MPYILYPPYKASLQIPLEELEKVSILGAGAFGQVTLVKRRGQYYALKVLSKAHIVHNGLQVRLCHQPLTIHVSHTQLGEE